MAVDGGPGDRLSARPFAAADGGVHGRWFTGEHGDLRRWRPACRTADRRVERRTATSRHRRDRCEGARDWLDELLRTPEPVVGQVPDRVRGFRIRVDLIGARPRCGGVSTAGGKLIFSIFGALAEFERNLIRERTSAGLAAARARGRVGGQPPKMTPKKIKLTRLMRDNGDESGRDRGDPRGRSYGAVPALEVTRDPPPTFLPAHHSSGSVVSLRSSYE